MRVTRSSENIENYIILILTDNVLHPLRPYNLILQLSQPDGNEDPEHHLQQKLLQHLFLMYRNSCYISDLICIKILFKNLGIRIVSDSQEKTINFNFHNFFFRSAFFLDQGRTFHSIFAKKSNCLMLPEDLNVGCFKNFSCITFDALSDIPPDNQIYFPA